MVTESEALAIKTRVAPRLLALPGVTAVGLGSKETRGQPTGELALKVFVIVKRPADQVAAAELIPAEIDGLPTDVIQSGQRHLVADPPGGLPTEYRDQTRSRPLTGGRRIRRENSNRGGTMGCFVVDLAQPGTVYGLTNYHVLAAPDVPAPVAGTSAVGQPTGESSVTGCCNDLFGKFAGGEKDDSSGKDEAAIRLDPGTQWLAEIVDIGIVTGSHDITVGEATAGTYKVRKRGSRTLLTGGVVTTVSASDGHSDNDLVIKPNPNPAAGTRTVFFDYEGDSGAAVVNDAGEVVGIMHSRDDSGNGYAYAIDHVLERLNVALSATLNVAVAAQAGVVNTVPGAAMVATPAELAAQLGPVPRPAPRPVPVPSSPVPAVAMPASLQDDLDRSATGRLLHHYLAHPSA